MVLVPPPLQTIPHKPRPSIYRCKPLTPRNSLSSLEFAFSLAKHNNALERAAVRGITSQILASHHSSLPKLKSTAVTPVFTGSVSSVTSSTFSQDSLTPQTPFTPPSPKVDQGSLHGIKPKADIFRNTTKSDELLDMTLAALHCIYVADFSQDSGSSQSKLTMQSGIDTDSSEIGAYRDCCDQSPGLIDESSVSSGSSTPDSISTPPSTPPDVTPEIACPSRGSTPEYHTTPYSAAAVKAKMQSIGRTQSLPSNYRYQAPTAAPRLVAEDKPRPVLEDKSLRWFLTELLRRSRASASVVQLALHYLKQAREPIGEVLNQKFKSVRVSGEDGSDIDSPLVDPRKLVLAAIMLSTKILHDHAPNSRAWSRVCGLEARQVSACESALGQALNWELMHMIVGPRDDSVLFE